ncbi:MAG TPA: hypothetical protein PLM75_06380 [bacterium]|nr:hypothetical protein [bacterium]HPP87469.1 hypothetical protein [bacterium]
MGYKRNKTKKVMEIIIFLIIACAIGFSFFSMDESLDVVEEKVNKLTVSTDNRPSVAALKKSIEKMSADEAEDAYLKYQQQLSR